MSKSIQHRMLFNRYVKRHAAEVAVEYIVHRNAGKGLLKDKHVQGQHRML
jgi:hypothetical protein